jgi:hypothetical protein
VGTVDAKVTFVLLKAVVIFFLIFVPYIIWSKLRFSLLKFFWKKDNFKSIVDVLFSLPFFELLFVVWLGLVFGVHNLLGFNIFSLLEQKAFFVLMFIIIVISYILEFNVFLLGTEKATLYISPIKEAGLGKSNNKYTLYLNGVRVLSSANKDDLREFIRKIKDYLKPDMQRSFEKFLDII